MIKKLKLSEFLVEFEKTPSVSPTKIPVIDELSYPLTDFFRAISEHEGTFSINNVIYNKSISSINNIYFFNEAVDDEFIIIFDPIIDIKRRLNEFTIFYYPDFIINLNLRECNGQEDQIKENNEGQFI